MSHGFWFICFSLVLSHFTDGYDANAQFPLLVQIPLLAISSRTPFWGHLHGLVAANTLLFLFLGWGSALSWSGKHAYILVRVKRGVLEEEERQKHGERSVATLCVLLYNLVATVHLGTRRSEAINEDSFKQALPRLGVAL